MSAVLAFDWGTSIVGILDVGTGAYVAYRSREEMVKGARRIVSSPGTIVSFNGNRCDLPELFKLVGHTEENSIRGTHDDMLKIASDARWPPDPGTGSILGQGLSETYRYYFGDSMPTPPAGLRDGYEEDNWCDCYMAAELWKKWQRGELGR